MQKKKKKRWNTCMSLLKTEFFSQSFFLLFSYSNIHLSIAKSMFSCSHYTNKMLQTKFAMKMIVAKSDFIFFFRQFFIWKQKINFSFGAQRFPLILLNSMNVDVLRLTLFRCRSKWIKCLCCWKEGNKKEDQKIARKIWENQVKWSSILHIQ